MYALNWGSLWFANKTFYTFEFRKVCERLHLSKYCHSFNKIRVYSRLKCQCFVDNFGNLCPENQWKRVHLENEEVWGLPLFLKVAGLGLESDPSFSQHIHYLWIQHCQIVMANSTHAVGLGSIPGDGGKKWQLVPTTRQDRYLNWFINRCSLYHCTLWTSKRSIKVGKCVGGYNTPSLPHFYFVHVRQSVLMRTSAFIFHWDLSYRGSNM